MKINTLQAIFWTTLAAASYAGVAPYSVTAVLAFIVVATTFAVRCNDYVPFAELAATIATLQWIFAPVFGYAFPTGSKYHMYVSADMYFSFALPATCLMNAVLLSWCRAPDPVGSHYRLHYSPQVLRYAAAVLIVFGIGCHIVAGRVPGSLAFIFNLLSQLPNVAALILIYHAVPNSKLLVLLAVAPVVVSAGSNAMFHSLLLWVAFIALYWLRARQRSVTWTAQVFLLGMIAVIFIQFFKMSYREQLTRNSGIGRMDAMTNALSLDLFSEEDNWTDGIVRFNQGWIVSAAMSHVPDYEPYAEGKTILDAAFAAIVVRALVPDKAKASGADNFSLYTGLYLHNGTSMGLSPLGEAYVNFGRNGGIVMMLAWGAMLGGFIHFLSEFAKSRPLFHFLIPLILYQGIKAETEFLTIFNQFTKGFALSLLIYWGIVQFGQLHLLRKRRLSVKH